MSLPNSRDRQEIILAQDIRPGDMQSFDTPAYETRLFKSVSDPFILTASHRDVLADSGHTVHAIIGAQAVALRFVYVDSLDEIKVVWRADDQVLITRGDLLIVEEVEASDLLEISDACL